MNKFLIFKTDGEDCSLTDKEKATLARIAASVDKRSKLSESEKRCFVVDNQEGLMFQVMSHRAANLEGGPQKSTLITTIHCVTMADDGALSNGQTWTESFRQGANKLTTEQR